MSDDSIRTRVWRNGVLERENFPFERVSDYLEEPDTLVWADLLRPSTQDLDQLAEELSLDPHAIEDAMGQYERPKVNRYATHLFLTASTIRFDAREERIVPGRVSAFCTHHAFVTVRLDDSVDIDSVVHRWDDNADLVKYGPRALAHGLLDEIVDRYFDALGALDTRVEELDTELFRDTVHTPKNVPQSAFALRRSLMTARRAVDPMREVVASMTHRWVAPEEPNQLTPYYEDLLDHSARASEWADSQREILNSIYETTRSLSDTHMNEIMKKLTSWAAIVAVPTAITGWFGQNVPYPGFAREWGVWFSLIAIVLVAAGLYATFKAKDWL